MRKKGDLSDFKRGMVVGARRAGLSISETADLLGFSLTTISRVYREWSKKEKISSERQLCGRKCLVDVRGQRRMDRLVRDDRKATVTQITTRYNQCMQNTISESTTHRTLKQMDYSSRRPHRVPLLSDKNRKQRLQFTQAHQNWTIEDWKNVAWSDESWFLLWHSDDRVRIWHKEHESMDPFCLVSMVQAGGGGGGVMVWGIFSWHTLCPLVPNEHRLSTIMAPPEADVFARSPLKCRLFLLFCLFLFFSTVPFYYFFTCACLFLFLHNLDLSWHSMWTANKEFYCTGKLAFPHCAHDNKRFESWI